MPKRENYQFQDMAKDVRFEVANTGEKLFMRYEGREDEDVDPSHFDMMQRAFIDMACSFPFAVLKANGCSEQEIIEHTVKSGMKCIELSLERSLGVEINLEAVHAEDIEGVQDAVDGMIRSAQKVAKH